MIKGEDMNLSDFFNREQKKEEQEIAFPILSFGGKELKQSSPFFLVLENKGKGKAKISVKCSLKVCLPCDRCLAPVEVPLVLNFEREVYAPDAEMSEEEREEQQFMKEYELDLEELLREELQLSWPSKVLCSEECKGICSVCGQNLNEGDCECDSFVPDIRLAGLMDIFLGNE
ncbi:MAG: DUF177 domain-containing protein [Lachnospiraceae bacterium]|nr:DUF177 domain-containing protein [Lachnospiraceae bacterium]